MMTERKDTFIGLNKRRRGVLFFVFGLIHKTCNYSLAWPRNDA